MRNYSSYEPGVIQAFRAFVGIRFGFVLIISCITLIFQPSRVSGNVMNYVATFDTFILFLYLSISYPLKRLKTLYLPAALIFATLSPILEQYLSIYYSRVNFNLPAIQIAIWQMILVLFIPLFIISWQYNFRWVVIFSLLIGVIDLTVPILLQIPLITSLGLSIFAPIFVRTISFVFLGYMISHMMATQRKLREELARANSDLTQYAVTLEQLSTSRERNRLARELHDVLAHTLSGLAIELEAVKKIWSINPDKAHTMLEHSLASVREGLTETRRALTALRASPLDDLGLLLALRNLAESIKVRTGFYLDYTQSEKIDEYPSEVELCFYRVTQEALTNISQHSGATQVSLSIIQENGRLILNIADNGAGFETSLVNNPQKFGLVGMRERAAMIGARLDITSQPSVGTTIRLSYDGEK